MLRGRGAKIYEKPTQTFAHCPRGCCTDDRRIQSGARPDCGACAGQSGPDHAASRADDTESGAVHAESPADSIAGEYDDRQQRRLTGPAAQQRLRGRFHEQRLGVRPGSGALDSRPFKTAAAVVAGPEEIRPVARLPEDREIRRRPAARRSFHRADAAVSARNCSAPPWRNSRR